MTGDRPHGTTGFRADTEAARQDPERVVLEGVHALKHAVRFGARVERIGSPEPSLLARLLADLAPDVQLPVPVERIDDGAWRAATRGGLPSPSLALARRPDDRLDAVLADRTGPIVLVEHATHLGNLGAVVRVAAAADVDGVLALGSSDPWHPRAVRGAAGLQFALPVARRDHLPTTSRPIVAVDPAGASPAPATLPSDAVLAFGTERHGLSDHLLARADHHVALPMRPGVSSLNLATAVAALLYAEVLPNRPAFR